MQDVCLQALYVRDADASKLGLSLALLFESVVLEDFFALCCPIVLNKVHEAIADIAKGALVNWQVQEIESTGEA